MSQIKDIMIMAMAAVQQATVVTNHGGQHWICGKSVFCDLCNLNPIFVFHRHSEILRTQLKAKANKPSSNVKATISTLSRFRDLSFREIQPHLDSIASRFKTGRKLHATDIRPPISAVETHPLAKMGIVAQIQAHFIALSHPSLGCNRLL